MKKTILLCLLLFQAVISSAQLDVKHYIPALFGRTNVQNHYMILSTPSAAPVAVDIKLGDGTLWMSTVITDVAPATILLGTGYAAPGMIGLAELNMPTNDGFIVEASAPIYVNLRHVQNAQGMSLTSKGASTGLGTTFRSGHIYSNTGIPYVKAHEISVMATEDNTTVTFSDISPNVIFYGTPVTGTTSNDITVVLNAGESYTIAALLDEPGATGNLNDVNGTLITSDKPIACNTGSWLSGAHNNLRDIGVDQIVPIELIGSEYIFVEGDGNANTERPLIVGAYDNTDVYVNGNPVPVATVNAGEYVYLPQTAYSANDNIYIETTQPIFMYQSLSGASPAATSLNFIPPLRCNGFKKVVIPSVNLVGSPTVSITARANADVFVNGSGTPLTGGLTVPGNSCWLTYKIPGGTGNFWVESDSIINVALLTLQGVRGSAGYFTGFAQFTEIDKGDTTSFIVCEDSATSFITYSIEGPYLSATADFYDPSLGGSITIDGFNADTLFFTYERQPGTNGPDTLDLTVCKLLDCCGAIPDTICEVSTLVFTNIQDINVGIGDSIMACADTADISMPDLLLGTFDPNGYWVDTDGTGALFGDSVAIGLLAAPGTYHFTYYVDGGSICYDSTIATITVEPMTTSSCCSIDPNFTLTDPSCFGYTDGDILITDIYATEFSIDAGATTQGNGNFTNIGSNNYDVLLTFGPDCSFDTTIVLNEPNLLDATFVIDSVSCFGACDGEIEINATGGTTPYTYSLGGAPGQSGNTYTGLCAGPATITITDDHNCQSVFPNTIPEPPLLTLSETDNQNETCSSGNGSLTVQAAGGTPVYLYQLNAGPTQTSGTFSGLSAGTYTIDVTDFNGCTATIDVTIIDEPAPVPYVDVLNDVTCAGGFNGSVTIGVNGGTGPFEFSLDAGPNQASNNFPSVGAGNHDVVVTDANGCTGTVNFNINQPTPLNYSTVITDVTCNGVCDGEIDITAGGAVPPYTYSSDNGLTFQGGNILTGLCAGNINVVVQDANGCLANSVENISEPTPVNSVQATVDPECHQTPTGEISFTPAGGTPGYQYSVDNGTTFSGTSPVTGLMAGTYDVVVQDANGCQFTDQVTLIDPPAFTFTFIANNPSNCGSNDGSFEIIVTSGGTAPFLYSIDGGFTVQVNNGFFDNLYSGLYNLQVEDANGCIDSVYSALSDNVMTSQTDFTSDVTCYGGNDGAVGVSQNFGLAPFTYTINTSTTSQGSGIFAGLEAGTYYVTIEDDGACVAIEQFTINEPDSITFTNPTVDITCPGGNDGEIDFAGVIGGDGGPYTYSIDGGATYVGSSLFTGLTAGTYDVLAQDGNGCLGATQVTLSEPPAFTAVINATDLTCNGNNTGFIQIIAGGATGPYDYTMTSTNTTGIFAGLAANTYNITITDVNGCTFDTTQTINEPAILAANYLPTDPLCNGGNDGQFEVVLGGGTPPYLYSDDNGVILQSSNILDALSAGCYDIYVEDANGCTLVSNECLGEPTQLTMTIATVPETCLNANGEIDITGMNGTPGYTYSIDDGSTFQAGNLFTGLTADSYDIILQDNNGCQIDSTISVTADALPVIDNVAYTNPLCFGGNEGTITITSSGGIGAHQYSITSALGPFQASNNFTGLVDGTYDVFVQDANGCVATSQVVLTEPAQIVVNSIPTDLTCYQNSTGILELSATGGTFPFTYSIDNGTTFQGSGIFNLLDAGNYDLVIEDVNGCQGTSIETINEPTPVIFDVFTVVDATCYGFCDATVTANASGGTMSGTYSYNWSGGIAGSMDDMAVNVCAGTYSLIVTDDNGCQNDTLNFVVNEPPQAIIDSVVTTPVTCFGDVDGVLDIYSANAGFYSIGSGFSGNTNYPGLATGIYWAYVQDANGCPGDSMMAFVATPQPLIGFVTPDVYICQADSVFFSVVGTGGTTPYNFDVNNGASTDDLIIEQIYSDTMYFVDITDANGCTYSTDTMFVFVAPPPVLITDNDTTICPGEPVSLTSIADDLLETYTYLWNTGETNPTIYPNVTSDTTFYVTVTDECNVSTIDSISVNLFVDPIITLTPDLTGGCPPFQVNYTVGVNLADLSSDLFWNTDYGTIDSSSFTNLYITYTNPGSGDIELSFTSSNGCQVDTTFISPIDFYGIPEANFYVNPTEPSIYDVNINLINTSVDYTSNQWFILGDTLLSTDAILDIAAMPEDSSVLVCLVVENEFGCTDTTCQYISIDNELFLFVPNCIILDGYSSNSYFLPVTNYFHPDWYSLQIFNRWGELIFETDDLNEGWDGTYNDNLVQDGVYVWKIVGAPVNNEADLREWVGHVTVLK